MPSSSITQLTRVGVMLLDHFCMCFIMMIPMIPYIFFNVFSAFEAGPGEEPELFAGPAQYLFALGFSLYVCKDSINGRSPAKRIAKLQVVITQPANPHLHFGAS